MVEKGHSKKKEDLEELELCGRIIDWLKVNFALFIVLLLLLLQQHQHCCCCSALAVALLLLWWRATSALDVLP